MDPGFWDYWYFHIPDYALAALIHLMLARAVLGIVLPAAWDSAVWRAFLRMTDPVVAAVGAVTPRSVPTLLIVVFAVAWLVAARAGFLVAMSALDWVPGTASAA